MKFNVGDLVIYDNGVDYITTIIKKVFDGSGYVLGIAAKDTGDSVFVPIESDRIKKAT